MTKPKGKMFLDWCPLPMPKGTFFVRQRRFNSDDSSTLVEMSGAVFAAEPGWPDIGDGQTLRITRRYEWIPQAMIVLTDVGYWCEVVKAKQRKCKP